jgi:hypothetical protein
MRKVHILLSGHAMCGKMSFPPRTWPKDHVWIGHSDVQAGHLKAQLQPGDELCADCDAQWKADRG